MTKSLTFSPLHFQFPFIWSNRSKAFFFYHLWQGRSEEVFTTGKQETEVRQQHRLQRKLQGTRSIYTVIFVWIINIFSIYVDFWKKRGIWVLSFLNSWGSYSRNRWNWPHCHCYRSSISSTYSIFLFGFWNHFCPIFSMYESFLGKFHQKLCNLNAFLLILVNWYAMVMTD